MSTLPPGVGVSVLVATRDRERDVRACLASLLACDYPAFEIIVVDQSERPAVTLTDPRLRVIHSRTRGKTVALNLALAQARHQVLAFTDDDCTVSRDWLTRGMACLGQAPRVGLVFGALVAAPHNPQSTFVPTFLPDRPALIADPRHADVRGGAGANMFARRELFDTIGGFDERFGPGSALRACEEYDVYYRTLRAGWTVARDPDNAVVHWGMRPYWDGSGQRLLRGYCFGEGAVLGKHVRTGDWTAVRLTARIFGEECLWALMGAARHRHDGLSRAASWAHGFVRGLVEARPALRRFEGA